MVRTPIISDIVSSSSAILLSIDVGVGDAIKMDQRVAEIDTDKATIDVRTPVGGEVAQVYSVERLCPSVMSLRA